MGLPHSHTMTPFDAPGNKPFENTVGKGEIAHNETLLLFLLSAIFVKFETVICKLFQL